MKKIIIIMGVTLALSTTLFASDGETLYKKCVGCHGAIGEKVALGKSKIINQMTEEELNTALNGYKEGTYGGAMKGIMKSQVAKYSTEDIATVSKFLAEKK